MPLELSRRDAILGALFTPFVIRTPGLLMPVSSRLCPTPIYGPNGVLTLEMITKEALRLLDLNLRKERGRKDTERLRQHCVTFSASSEQFLKGSLQDFSNSVLEPAMTRLATLTDQQSISDVPLSIPNYSHVLGAQARLPGRAAMRGVSGYDINIDALVYSFDITST